MDNNQDQVQRLVSMGEFVCGKCGGKVVVRIPEMAVVNKMNFSQVTFTHERPVTCPKCQEMFLPLLAGVTEKMELKLVWKRVSAESKNKPTLATEVSPESQKKSVETIMAQINSGERKM